MKYILKIMIWYHLNNNTLNKGGTQCLIISLFQRFRKNFLYLKSTLKMFLKI